MREVYSGKRVAGSSYMILSLKHTDTCTQWKEVKDDEARQTMIARRKAMLFMLMSSVLTVATLFGILCWIH
jgi:hypothetical protein